VKISNRSKTYLLPLLSEIVKFDMRFFKYILNTFIFDDIDKYKDSLYILHRTDIKDPEFTAYENKLLDNEYFVNLYDVDSEYSLYVFKFPDHYLHEYYSFKKGGYSKFGEDAKEFILDFWEEVHKENVNKVKFLLKLKQVLFKDDKLKRQIEEELKLKLSKDAELADVIEPKNETYPLSKLVIEANDKKIKI